jgi:hypothetical protein
MYTLTKKSSTSYNIILRGQVLGTATLDDNQWFAKIGHSWNVQSNLKKAVEGLLYQIIMNGIETRLPS